MDLDVPRGTQLATAEPYLRMMLRCPLDTAARWSEPDDRIAVSSERDGDTVVIDLSDDGPGLTRLGGSDSSTRSPIGPQARHVG